MATFLVDEDLPRSLVESLRNAGIQALDVRDAGLRGLPDQAIHDFAVRNGHTIVTADVGFANALRFPPELRRGVVLVRLPNDIGICRLCALVVAALVEWAVEDMTGITLVIEERRIRVRHG